MLVDQADYFAPVVGEPNPYLRHGQQHGLVLDGLNLIRQAQALFGKFLEVQRPHALHPQRIE
jgi:hypothetical protein